MAQTTVLIADDHAIVRTGLALLLEAKGVAHVVGEADNGESAVRLACELKPDVVVMDIMMPGRDGIDATREIAAREPGTKVLVLTTSTVAADLAQALQAGAYGIVVKSDDTSALVAAIAAVARGERVLSPELANLVRANDAPPELTARQIAILSAVAKGFSYPDIAHALGVSVITVKKHMESVLAKLGAANRSEAVAIAVRARLLR